MLALELAFSRRNALHRYFGAYLRHPGNAQIQFI
jgi:hypothetical protein